MACLQTLDAVSLTYPVEVILFWRWMESTVRFCDHPSETAARWGSAFPVPAPRRWCGPGEFPERPPEVNRVCKAGGFGDCVER